MRTSLRTRYRYGRYRDRHTECRTEVLLYSSDTIVMCTAVRTQLQHSYRLQVDAGLCAQAQTYCPIQLEAFSDQRAHPASHPTPHTWPNAAAHARLARTRQHTHTCAFGGLAHRIRKRPRARTYVICAQAVATLFTGIDHRAPSTPLLHPTSTHEEAHHLGYCS